MSNSNIPPRAKPVAGLQGTPPLAVGKPMVLRPSPAERAVLEEVGWTDGTAVPDNIGEIIAEAQRDANDLDSMPPPGDMRTPPLVVPKTTNVASLPASEQARYASVMDAFANAQAEHNEAKRAEELVVPGADPSVNDAIRAAAKPVIANDLQSDSYATGEAKTAPTPAPAATHASCPHCGWDQDIADPVEVSDDDKAGFLQSLLGSVPFTKTYTLLGGKALLTVRALTLAETDSCFRQLSLDAEAGKIRGLSDQTESLRRYRTGLQLSEAWIGDKSYFGIGDKSNVEVAPGTLALVAWNRLVELLDRGESMHRMLMNTVDEFNKIMTKMEANVLNSDFWKAIDMPSC